MVEVQFDVFSNSDLLAGGLLRLEAPPDFFFKGFNRFIQLPRALLDPHFQLSAGLAQLIFSLISVFHAPNHAKPADNFAMHHEWKIMDVVKPRLAAYQRPAFGQTGRAGQPFWIKIPTPRF